MSQSTPECYAVTTRLPLEAFRLLLNSLADCLNQHQRDVIDHLQEENSLLREQLGKKRLRLNDDQRRRLAVKAKNLGWRVLHGLTTIVTPETLLAWQAIRWFFLRNRLCYPLPVAGGLDLAISSSQRNRDCPWLEEWKARVGWSEHG